MRLQLRDSYYAGFNSRLAPINMLKEINLVLHHPKKMGFALLLVCSCFVIYDLVPRSGRAPVSY